MRQPDHPGPRPELLYDGHCNLCVASMRAIRRLDWLRRLSYTDVQTNWEDVSARFPTLSREDVLGEMHLIRPDGRVLRGFAAVRCCLRFVPLLMPLAALCYLPGMLLVGARVYRFVAARRYRWFGYADCADGACKLPNRGERNGS